MPVKATRKSSASTAVRTVDQPELPMGSPVAPPAHPAKRSAFTTRDAASATLQEVLNRLQQQKQRCVDVETSGLNWRKNHIVGYVVTFGPAPQDSYYIPFRHFGNANVGERSGPTTAENWDEKLAPGERELVTALDQQGTTLFGHNMSFDLKFLSRVEFTFRPRIEDTIINAPLIDELQGKFSLEFCANDAGVQAKKSAQMSNYLCEKFNIPAAKAKEAMGHFWRLPGDDSMAMEYATGDGTTTWQLRDWQMKEIEKQELTRVWDVESRLIPVLARMSVKGIRIDEERFTWLKTYIKSSIDALKREFPEDFNERSSLDVRHWMEQHGHTDWPTTANGQPSMIAAWLENYEAGKKVIKIRKLSVLRDTFALPLQVTHLHNGRVHTNFNQLRGDEYGTVTGRLSSDSPNLQAVPKHDEETGRLYRSIFVPDPSMTWASVDYNQCEPRLLAYYSRCKVLFDGYMSDPPVDAHTAVAVAANRRWHTLTPSEQKHYRNAYAKRINQTIITGGGKNVLVEKYKVPREEVDQVWNDYFRAMPEVRMIQKKMSKRMEDRGYLLTLLGRRCRLQHRDKSYVALNRALQGGNADILKLKMVEVDEYLDSIGRPLDMLLNCHDATEFQFPEEARKHYQECLRIMQDFASNGAVIKLDIPMTVDAGEGPNWAVATYGPEKPVQGQQPEAVQRANGVKQSETVKRAEKSQQPEAAQRADVPQQPKRLERSLIKATRRK